MVGGDEIVGGTPRLRLRRLRLSDIDEVAAMVADPEQMRFYPRPKSRDEVGAWLAWNLALYEESGFGTWYLESVLDNGFAGLLRDSPAPAGGPAGGRVGLARQEGSLESGARVVYRTARD